MLLTAVRAFEAAARHQSVRRAAEELCVTPGAVSQQVVLLEHDLGLPLFNRISNRLHLTTEGSRLAARLGTAFDQIDIALRETRESTAPTVLRLRIAPTLAARWLMPRLGDFLGRHPQLHVELATNVAQGNEPALEGVDFAICLVEELTPDEDMLLLFRDALCPVCTPAMATRLKSLGDLASVPLLHSMLREESWKIWAESAGCPVPVAHGPRFATAALAYQAAAEGLGVAVAQMAYVEADLREGRFVTPFAHVATSAFSYYLVNAAHKRAWTKVRQFRAWMAGQLEGATALAPQLPPQ
ncbi:MAG TPA: LysR substrate-binding domain-containing protein [Lysobacter sp.]|jgi:DNA-binding transcriptional LysR family regulator|nr:LysR substrate-binding domain-containing protein [Lysobacter sp.]